MYSEDDPGDNTVAVTTENSKCRKVDLSLDEESLFLSLRKQVIGSSSRVKNSGPPDKHLERIDSDVSPYPMDVDMEDEPVSLQVIAAAADKDQVMGNVKLKEDASGLDYDVFSDSGQSSPDEDARDAQSHTTDEPPASLPLGPGVVAEEEADEDLQGVAIRNTDRNLHELQNKPPLYYADELPFTIQVKLDVAEEEDGDTDADAFSLENSPSSSKARGSDEPGSLIGASATHGGVGIVSVDFSNWSFPPKESNTNLQLMVAKFNATDSNAESPVPLNAPSQGNLSKDASCEHLLQGSGVRADQEPRAWGSELPSDAKMANGYKSLKVSPMGDNKIRGLAQSSPSMASKDMKTATDRGTGWRDDYKGHLGRWPVAQVKSFANFQLEDDAKIQPQGPEVASRMNSRSGQSADAEELMEEGVQVNQAKARAASDPQPEMVHEKTTKSGMHYWLPIVLTLADPSKDIVGQDQVGQHETTAASDSESEAESVKTRGTMAPIPEEDAGFIDTPNVADNTELDPPYEQPGRRNNLDTLDVEEPIKGKD
ncbi:hypothetical protein EST38_g10374 [Candolleomyces aberdarensis]|uniref:Uncharacterized protein n=1 Tax=Candolleomyces aberdarensis TaxID=2316362 RepID=A0A4Q2D7J2_9AGAR|nr:hypothetical protein EST38_g10374 [Candolleomyces aberdarensis]